MAQEKSSETKTERTRKEKKEEGKPKEKKGRDGPPTKVQKGLEMK